MRASLSLLILLCLLLSSSALTRTELNGIQFVDITKPAGITFEHVSSPEKRYIVESMSGGVALLDYDNDGFLDIYFVNSLTVDLVKTNGKNYDAVIVAVNHKDYLKLEEKFFKSILTPKGILVDVKGMYRGKIKSIPYWSL